MNTLLNISFHYKTISWEEPVRKGHLPWHIPVVTYQKPMDCLRLLGSRLIGTCYAFQSPHKLASWTFSPPPLLWTSRLLQIIGSSPLATWAVYKPHSFPMPTSLALAMAGLLPFLPALVSNRCLRCSLSLSDNKASPLVGWPFRWFLFCVLTYIWCWSLGWMWGHLRLRELASWLVHGWKGLYRFYYIFVEMRDRIARAFGNFQDVQNGYISGAERRGADCQEPGLLLLGAERRAGAGKPYGS